MSSKIRIGDRLKQLIRETGKEQQVIASELGIKVPTFNGYVSSQREPSIDKLKQLAGYFNVTIDYLTGNSEIRNPYLSHLTPEMGSFVRQPENISYLELAMDIKEKTNTSKKRSMI